MAGISIGEIYAVGTLFFRQHRIQLHRVGMVAARYIWPGLRLRSRAEALRPLLILHSFRFIGLAFLVPGVVSSDVPSAFARGGLWGRHCGDTRLACAGIAAQWSRRRHRMDLQPLGFSRYPQCLLPGQSHRAHGGAVGSRILHSDFDSAATADYARTRFPSSSATSS
jgi:hypothetical protein